LYSINLATGAASLIGSVNTGGGTITGMALPVSATNPVAADGSIVTAIINGTQLAQFASTAAGVATVANVGTITGLATGDSIVDIDFRPSTATQPTPAAGTPAAPTGMLYGFSTLGILYSISPSALTATPITLVADTAVPPLRGAKGVDFTGVLGTNFGIDFNPVPDRLRVVSNQNQDLRINVVTGLALVDNDINLSGPIAPNVFASAYTNPFVPALIPPNVVVPPTTILFDLDLSTSTLQRQDPANGGVLTQVGRLDPIFTFTQTGEFDITGGENGLVLGVLQRTGATQSSLYRIDLTTGQATLIGDIGPSATPTLIKGLALRLR
jgi:hypothetical protein